MNEEYDPFEEVTPMEALEGILYYSFRDVENKKKKTFKMWDLQRSVYRLTEEEERLGRIFPFHQGTKYSEELEQALSFLTMSNRVWRDLNPPRPGLTVGDSKNFEKIEEDIENLPQPASDLIEKAVEKCIDSGEYEILSRELNILDR